MVDSSYYQKVSLVYTPPVRTPSLTPESVKVHVLLLGAPANFAEVLSNTTFDLSVELLNPYPLPTNAKAVLQSDGSSLVTFTASDGDLYSSTTVSYTIDRIVRVYGSNVADFAWTNIQDDWTPDSSQKVIY
jgi:hypothetical protein